MYELIAKIVLIGSFIGIITIVVKKMPVLVSLSVTSQEKRVFAFGENIKDRMKKYPLIGKLSFQNFVQKILSKLRVLTLKIENKTEKYLQLLRERSKKQKQSLDDKYWQKLKETKNHSENKPR